MKKIYLILTTCLFLSCSSSETAFYQANTADNWEVDVIHKSGITDNFKVKINDSTVIDESANFVTGNLEAKGKYRQKKVKLTVSYSDGFLGIGAAYHAYVFIENQLVAKFKF